MALLLKRTHLAHRWPITIGVTKYSIAVMPIEWYPMHASPFCRHTLEDSLTCHRSAVAKVRIRNVIFVFLSYLLVNRLIGLPKLIVCIKSTIVSLVQFE